MIMYSVDDKYAKWVLLAASILNSIIVLGCDIRNHMVKWIGEEISETWSHFTEYINIGLQFNCKSSFDKHLLVKMNLRRVKTNVEIKNDDCLSGLI